jgi:hypothetical protein
MADGWHGKSSSIHPPQPNPGKLKLGGGNGDEAGKRRCISPAVDRNKGLEE